MKRRKFIASTAILGTGALQAKPSVNVLSNKAKSNEFYELRSYELSFGGNRKSLFSYLNNTLHPTLWQAGIEHTMIFKELGDAEPAKIWTLYSYPDLETYLDVVDLMSDDSFIAQTETYTAAGKTYNRYSSFLLSAFNGMPTLLAPGADKKLFELRIYEGENEDAVRRKVIMFDKDEIKLFKKVGLDAVFFGNMIVGPYMPCLAYMLAFDNMEARSKAWGQFVAHPDWNKMKDLPQYANTVSNIRKIFLERI